MKVVIHKSNLWPTISTTYRHLGGNMEKEIAAKISEAMGPGVVATAKMEDAEWPPMERVGAFSVSSVFFKITAFDVEQRTEVTALCAVTRVVAHQGGI